MLRQFDMCVGPLAAPKKAAPPPLPPPPMAEAKAPKEPKGIQRRRSEEKRRMTALRGDRSTMLTGSQGVLTPASIGGATLLGGGMSS